MPYLHESLSRHALRLFDARLHKRYQHYVAHFRKVVGYQPAIALPRRYHEKMLWRKLFDHSPDIATFCDKLATKEYIRKKHPGLKLPRTLWVGDRLEDIPPDILSEKLMLKCNHGCGYNFRWIPGESSAAEARAAFRGWMGQTYGTTNYEWGYSTVRPKVFAEEFIGTSDPFGLVDIKIRCCAGRPILARIHLDGLHQKKRAAWFSVDANRLFEDAGPLADGDQELPAGFQIPQCFDEAIKASRILGANIDYARIDFFAGAGELIGGEITVYPAAGLGTASPEGFTGPDTLTNEHWDLRKSWFLTAPQKGFARLYAATLKKAL